MTDAERERVDNQKLADVIEQADIQRLQELVWPDKDRIVAALRSQQPPTCGVRELLGAFYKIVDVMKSARNSENKTMNVWADDMKAVEDVVFFLENLRDAAPHQTRATEAAKGRSFDHAQCSPSCGETDHIDWDILAEERLGQRPVEHGRHIPQTSPAPGCDSGSPSAQAEPEPLRELVEFWMNETRLQTFEDRQRFRKAARNALALPSTDHALTAVSNQERGGRR